MDSARQADADAEAARILQEVSAGTIARPDPQTVSEFLEQWLNEYADHKCAPKTVERYRELARHINNVIGDVPLTKLTTLQLQRAYNVLLETRKKNGSQISIKTVRHVHGLVHVAFETAVRWGLLRKNPADGCELPPAPQTEAKVLDYSGVLTLLDASSDHWLAELLRVDTASGARRGELLSLTWANIDLATGMMTISKSLEQTKKGLRVKETKGRRIRRLKLPDDAIEALNRVRQQQAENRKMFGPDYRGDLDLVFCHPDGSFVRPDTVTKAVRRLAKKAGFKGVSLHTLRHSHGSQLLSAGVPLPTVSKRLGHSNPQVTATVYAHALPADELAAAQIWQEAMTKATGKNEGASTKILPIRRQRESA